MKLITFVVPAYNSEYYLQKCLNSILVDMENIEIIVVNDGSTDRTKNIAEEFVNKFPEVVKLISKENGGHGSAINAGLERAQGLFFKVVDADDWLDSDELLKVIGIIKKHVFIKEIPDLYIHNFIYDKPSINAFFVRTFKRQFSTDKFTTWKNVKKFRGSEVLLMHSLMYRTEILKQSTMKLPHYTYYVDNLYAYKPLPFVTKMYYMDIDLYHYYIGREDQSVNISMFTRNYKQQIRVMKEMVQSYSYEQIRSFCKNLSKYMFHCLGAIMMITILFTVAKNETSRHKNLREMWGFIKQKDRKLYWKLRIFSLPVIVNYTPKYIKGYIMVIGYKYLRRRLKLG